MYLFQFHFFFYNMLNSAIFYKCLPIIFPYFWKISSNSFFVMAATGTFPTKTLAFIKSRSLIFVRFPIGGVLLFGRGDLCFRVELLLRLLLYPLGDLLGDLRLSRLLDLILWLRLLLRLLGLRLLDLLSKGTITLPNRSKRSRDVLRDLVGILWWILCDL